MPIELLEKELRSWKKTLEARQAQHSRLTRELVLTENEIQEALKKIRQFEKALQWIEEKRRDV